MPRIDTFDELMDRAKVAQQAIRDLNLNLVEAHDQRELQKLEGAIDTLHTLTRDIAPVAVDAADAFTPAAVTPAAIAQAPAETASAASTAPAEGTAKASPPASTAAATRAMATSATPESQPTSDLRAARPPAAVTPDASPAVAPAPGPRPAVPRAAEVAAVRPAIVQAARPVPAASKPVVTPSTAATTFQEQISKGIYTRRIGRIFCTGAGMGMVPIGKMPHREGLPAFDNCLAPDDTPVDGAYGVFVSTSYVFAAVLRRPFDSHRWKVIETINCRQQREIVDAVAHLLRRPTMNIIVED